MSDNQVHVPPSTPAPAPAKPPRSANHAWIFVLAALVALCVTCVLLLKYSQDDTSSPTHIAAKTGDLAELERLLKEDPTRANLKLKMDATPIHWAAAAGQLESVRLLLKYHADPNLLHTIGGTALHAAVRYDHAETVELLLDNGAAINSRNMKNQTPLYTAAEYNLPAMVALLLNHHADGNLVDLDYKTPLAIARQTGHEEVVKILTAAGYTQ